MEETPLEINENKINLFPESQTLTCADCPYIPSIKINTNQHSINVECQNNLKITSEPNNISGHFHNKILLEDYLLKLRNNVENNKKSCSICKKKIIIDNIYYCPSCKDFLCVKCLNDKHLKEKNDHPTLKFDLININCCIHNKINKYYCNNCFKHLCQSCIDNNKLHKKHEIIKLDDILINDKYLKEVEQEINDEEKNIKIMSKKFEQYINFIQNKFDEYIQLRNDEIYLKKNILYNYDKYKNNYNAIMNVKKLKFDYFKIDPDNEKQKEKQKEKEENKESKNLKKLRNIKKLINELILYEQTRNQQKNKEQNKKEEEIKTKNQIDNNNSEKEKDKDKEKEKTKCYKENISLKSQKYEIVSKIHTKNADAEQILTLKNNKLLIAYNNRKLVIYEINYFKNNIEELFGINLSPTKFNAIRSHISNFKGIYELKNGNILVSMTGLSCFILKINYETKSFSVVQEFMISRGLRTNNPLFANIPVDANNYDDVIPVFQNSLQYNNNLPINNINNNIIINNNTINGNVNNVNNNTNTININGNVNNVNNNNNTINNNGNVNNVNNNNVNDMKINLANYINQAFMRINNANNVNNANNINNVNINDINNNNNNNNLNNAINNNQPIINNNNNHFHHYNINQIVHPIRFMPHGILNRITNRIGVPINHPLPHGIINRVNNIPLRKRTLINLVALPNDDLLAISSKDCWILRKNSIKYVIYKDQIIKCNKILMVKKALSISDNEFLVEITISKPKHYHPYGVVKSISKKSDLVYIFFNLQYEEICRKQLEIYENNRIKSDNDYIYINDMHSLFLLNMKNKEIVNIIEIESIGPIIPIKENKSFIIQEKEKNCIVEYRIINNEIVRGEVLIKNSNVKLIDKLDDISNTLIIQYKDEELLFFQ